jgi:hypothetical protein
MRPKATASRRRLDIGLYMGGSLAMKSVRYAFQIMEEVRARRG